MSAEPVQTCKPPLRPLIWPARCARGHDRTVPGAIDDRGACLDCRRMRDRHAKARTKERDKLTRVAAKAARREGTRKHAQQYTKSIKVQAEIEAMNNRIFWLIDQLDLASEALRRDIKQRIADITKAKDALERGAPAS